MTDTFVRTDGGAPSDGVFRVFISYRREDASGYAGRLYDRLATRFAPEQLFIDVDSIEAGVDFVDAINDAVSACDVVLAVIGPRWISVTDARGNRRLDAPEDFVRLEVEAALHRGVRLIPVLVGNAVMPSSVDLPPSLQRLARINAIGLSDDRWRTDADRLIRVLERLQEQKGGVPASLGGSPAGSAAGAAVGAVTTTAGIGAMPDRPLAASVPPVSTAQAVPPPPPVAGLPQAIGVASPIAPPAASPAARGTEIKPVMLAVPALLVAALLGIAVLTAGGGASPSPSASVTDRAGGATTTPTASPTPGPTPTTPPTASPTAGPTTPPPTASAPPTASTSPTTGPSAVPTLPGGIDLFRTDFTQPVAAWPEDRSGESATYYYEGGAYWIELLKPEWMAWTTAGFDSRFEKLANAEVRVRAASPGVSPLERGVLCRYTDADNFYTLGLSGSRVVIAGKKKGEWVTLKELALAPGERPTEIIGKCEIGMLVEGSVFLAIWLDGEVRVVHSDPEPLAPGLVGVYTRTYAEETGRARFDDLRIISRP